MSETDQVMRRPSTAEQEKTRLTLKGVQALLIGRVLQDREAVLAAGGGDDRRRPARYERGFFDLVARYGDSLDRAGEAIDPTARRGGGGALLHAIGGQLNEITASPLVAARGSTIKSLTAFDDGTYVPEDTVVDAPPPPDEVAYEAPAELTFQDYPAEAQQAAQAYWESNTVPALDATSKQIVEGVQNWAASGGGAGGMPIIVNGTPVSDFFTPSGDLNIGRVNDLLTGVAVVGALGVGGLAGAALGALALIAVPRMLAAVEEELAEFLTGSLPGY